MFDSNITHKERSQVKKKQSDLFCFLNLMPAPIVA